jgi:hypothetical protein
MGFDLPASMNGLECGGGVVLSPCREERRFFRLMISPTSP